MKKVIFLIMAVGILAFQGYRFYRSPKGSDIAHVEIQTEAASAEPIHSKYYIAGLSVDTLTEYFTEVVLSCEYPANENVTRVQRWETPIYYELNGIYTDEDLSTLESFIYQLNKIDGFPGMYPANGNSNFIINFLDYDTFLARTGELVNYENVDGAVNWWYDIESNAFTSEEVFYRTDIEQYNRNSVILEEIINGLGLRNDSSLRTDSIIYQGVSFPQQPTEIDWLIIKLLYSGAIRCGMDESQCIAAIQSLYY